MIRIKNPDILRERVKKTESKIKAIVNKSYNGYVWNLCSSQRYKMELLLIERAAYLNRMFTGTPEEIKRFELLNDKLLRMANDMRTRAAMLWETTVTMNKMPDFDDEYEVQGVLRIRGWDEEVLKVPEDDYYGSDFLFMSEIINEMVPDSMSQAYSHCG